uniref:Purotoxin-1 n=1 Tax=Alopecosa marikovskyi TaxID=2066572 RepID=TXPR1_ALOMR|nr:RecName: Full=Purotoxin-1; Short=PT1; AltName: Full=OMICRON-lycotoxin-Am1a; Short=OMICRON-LCTX-Am1a [Alopecosa marikovskyi]2KGU_A Chain A, Purotoxin-1 [Alopecosa marikovskyi]
GYCAEKGIRCDDIHCCTGLKCKCNASGYNCVCRKK